MTDEAKALVERCRKFGTPTYMRCADLIETQAREIERLITENAYLREALQEARAALGESHD